MSRRLCAALLLLALGCASCTGTETGNPDPGRPRDDAGSPHAHDGGVQPRADGGVTSDASVPRDAGAQDAGAEVDAGLDGGRDEDGGDVGDAGTGP